MSLLAGIYSFGEHLSARAAAIETIRARISRRGDGIETFHDHRFFIAKLDIDAFRDRAFRVAETVTTVTGEPLLRPAMSRRPCRGDDLEELAEELDRGNLAALRLCQGSFSVCHYNPANGLFLLATDRVGVRAVYFHIGASAIFFSSNLRVLEGIAEVPKRADLRAMTECAALGYPLADRTPFVDIRVLRGGEVLRWREGSYHLARYFDWRDVEAADLPREEMLDKTHEAFVAAVACRSARSKQANSFLSGGLDSRAIVATLVGLGKTVDTLTYEIAGSKDAIFSRRASEHLGTRHHPRPFDSTKGHREQMADSLGQLTYPAGAESDFPSLIFSGDGGSVGLGFVYVTDTIVDAMRRGDLAAVARRLARGWPPRRIFRSKVREAIGRRLAEGIHAELARPRTRDPAWDFYAYLMDNDQRRHLHLLYEDLDLRRMEVLLPFFDGRLLESIASGTADWFMYHRFYADWLDRLPGSISSTPWQSYQGHVACPHPEAQEGRRDFAGAARSVEFARSARRFRQCRAVVLGPSFPAKVLRRTPMMAALFLHGLRIANYDYVFRICMEYEKWLSRSRGEMAVAPAAPASQ